MDILTYILKVSISLAIVYTFYRVALNRLTFYHWNRIYLLGYAVLSVLIPLIDVGSWLANKPIADDGLIMKVPLIAFENVSSKEGSGLMPLMVVGLIAAGAVVFLARMLLQVLSLRKLRSSAVSRHSDGQVEFIETPEAKVPFSFGNSIYFSKTNHAAEELDKIILHEIVHVRGRHTIDLIFTELLCALNWFNPFAWLIRSAVRQNLEFIADQQVVKAGIDAKHYQYLLVSVAGEPRFSVVNNFSLQNLKKRIVMMNKVKSSALHLTRFLFALPLVAFLLVAFRQQPRFKESQPNVVLRDTVPEKYLITVADNMGECLVIVKNSNKKIIEAITLTDWYRDQKHFESKYGELKDPVVNVTKGSHSDARPVKAVSASASNESAAISVGETEIKADQVTVTEPAILSVASPDVLLIIDGAKQPVKVKKITIPPSEIEAMTVLKGEGAIEKYGDDAKNGAIEIQTKKKKP